MRGPIEPALKERLERDIVADRLHEVGCVGIANLLCAVGLHDGAEHAADRLSEGRWPYIACAA